MGLGVGLSMSLEHIPYLSRNALGFRMRIGIPHLQAFQVPLLGALGFGPTSPGLGLMSLRRIGTIPKECSAVSPSEK